MRKIIIYIILTLSIMTGCSIDRLPHGYMVADAIEKDPAEALDATLSGTYAQMKVWTDHMHRAGEYAGDNMSIRGNSSDGFMEFITYNRTPANYRLDAFWNGSYKVIAQTSNIMKLIKEGQSAEIDTKLGECYYLRGLMYFYLCRAFGKPYYQDPENNLGVPIVNGTPEDMTNIVLPDRATVKETYAQAISDLEKAAAMMTVESPKHAPAFASKWAAYALLSRIYLYMSGTWEDPIIEYAKKSADYATLVIESGKYILLGREDFMKYNQKVPENNKESIFVVKMLASEAPNHWSSIGGMYSNVAGQGWGEMFASAKYLDLLNETGRTDFYNKSYVDARAAFIGPVYSGEKRVFRFVRNSYAIEKDGSNGVHTGFTYVQADSLDRTDVAAGKIIWNEKYIAKKDDVNFTHMAHTLTRAPQTKTSDSVFSFTYRDGEKYTGVIDNFMKLNNGHPEFYILKTGSEGEQSQLHSPIISRLGEVYLNRAEAFAKQGKFPEALEDLNEIRTRSLSKEEAYNNTEFNSTTAASLIDKERTLELAYQAERSYDVFRNGGSLTRKYPGGHPRQLDVINANDFRVTYFIPQDAINAYAPNVLTQNPLN